MFKSLNTAVIYGSHQKTKKNKNKTKQNKNLIRLLKLNTFERLKQNKSFFVFPVICLPLDI